MYNFYKDKNIPQEYKVIYNWEEVYKCKKVTNEDDANTYKNGIQKEIDGYGINSEYVQTQYYCSFNVRGGRLITQEDLEKFNTLRGNMTDNISDYNTNPLIYRIASFDPALTEDYAALSIGVAVKMPEENRFKVALKNCYSLNQIGVQESSDRLLDKVVDVCEANNIDMLILDATASQKDRARRIVEKLNIRNINTMVVPFSYANQNKQRMMTALIDSINSEDLILPEKKYTELNSDYKELLDELLYIQAVQTPSGAITYKAPVGSSFHDD